jgi:hypothetical protein
VHSLKARRFPTRAREADCWLVETFRGIRRTWRLDRVEEGWNLALPFGLFRDHPKGTAMKLTTIALAAALALAGSFAYAQSGAPSGAGSTTGDPAASSAAAFGELGDSLGEVNGVEPSFIGREDVKFPAEPLPLAAPTGVAAVSTPAIVPKNSASLIGLAPAVTDMPGTSRCVPPTLALRTSD